ncbi:hypothetical protein BCR35DRAFT_343551 [Leucosporidium creatinivorum]|uniref:PB1 domain-containing protein n=1 Tax=Leucosporidium creatinivorum TaxID=106004 RepID=A0A1Y2EU20_9BASI|nr:hypothetical protein BCR35DRAFT_343551 [Leucosporidium creatinivorum]
MSLKQELQIWSNALDAFDVQDFNLSVSLFQEISDSSKILFNLGLIHATIGSHAEAVEYFDQAVSLDQYLAVAYFQEGVSNFLLGRYEVARRDFDDAFVYMRSNLTIDYEQLGLKFRLYSCEVLFNRGLASIYMGLQEQGMTDLQAALQEKQTDEHSVIDEAIADRGDGYTVFSIPVGILFRPSANKLKNLETKNYLGQAKLIAATDARDAFTGFSGTNPPPPLTNPQRSESDPSEGGGLSRSKTSAARLESSGDGVARPLRRRPTVEEMGGQPIDRVANWARMNTGAPPPLQQQQQGSSGTISRESSASERGGGGGGMSRARMAMAQQRQGGLMRQGAGARGGRVEMGDGAEEFEGMTMFMGEREMSKVRVKLRYQGDTRGMSITPDLAHQDFVERVRIKFASEFDLPMKYRDSDGALVSIIDADDWESAMDQAREAAQGRAEGKLEIMLAES